MRRLSVLSLGVAVVFLALCAPAAAYDRTMGAGGAMHEQGVTPPAHENVEHSSMYGGETPHNTAMASKTNAELAAKNPGEILSQNTRLAAKLTEILPPNSDLQKEAQGFKTLGDFVAAVHVSHDLNIPWEQLRAKLINGENLGQAIKELDPQANPKAEIKKAKTEARKDVQETMSTT